jgi:hypothetical protein
MKYEILKHVVEYFYVVDNEQGRIVSDHRTQEEADAFVRRAELPRRQHGSEIPNSNR